MKKILTLIIATILMVSCKKSEEVTPSAPAAPQGQVSLWYDVQHDAYMKSLGANATSEDYYKGTKLVIGEDGSGNAIVGFSYEPFYAEFGFDTVYYNTTNVDWMSEAFDNGTKVPEFPTDHTYYRGTIQKISHPDSANYIKVHIKIGSYSEGHFGGDPVNPDDSTIILVKQANPTIGDTVSVTGDNINLYKSLFR